MPPVRSSTPSLNFDLVHFIKQTFFMLTQFLRLQWHYSHHELLRMPFPKEATMSRWDLHSWQSRERRIPLVMPRRKLGLCLSSRRRISARSCLHGSRPLIGRVDHRWCWISIRRLNRSKISTFVEPIPDRETDPGRRWNRKCQPLLYLLASRVNSWGGKTFYLHRELHKFVQANRESLWLLQ